MDQLLLVCASTSEAQRFAQAESLDQATESLCTIIVEKDWPQWLTELRQAVTEFLGTQNEQTLRQLIATIARHLYSVNQQNVLPDVDSGSTYRFDEFYEQARNQAKLAELFDAHIQAITALIDSGEIESVTVLNALIQLVAILKANRNASYASVKQTVFLARFIQNSVMIALKQIPGLGILVEAAEKTLNETEHGLDDLDRDMKALLLSAVRRHLPRIESASTIIEQQVRALPAPKEELQEKCSTEVAGVVD